MYEKIAWDHFYKTGNLESFIEYKKLMEINNNMQNELKEKGDAFSELNQIKSSSNKRNNI